GAPCQGSGRPGLPRHGLAWLSRPALEPGRSRARPPVRSQRPGRESRANPEARDVIRFRGELWFETSSSRFGRLSPEGHRAYDESGGSISRFKLQEEWLLEPMAQRVVVAMSGGVDS